MHRQIWGATTDWPLALRAHRPQAGFSTPRYVSRGFRNKNKKSGPRTPPSGLPVLASLVRSAEGLPSTRNWPFRWPLPPTSPHQVIPKAM
jgi:hypothetical protein